MFYKKKKNNNFKKYKKILLLIKYYQYYIKKLNNLELKNKTLKFKRLFKKGINLNKILPEAFAVVIEISKRIFNIIYYKSQIIGGIALHYNKIIEMNTGEGKTLTAILPAYLNALTGKGVHIVTTNNYLSLRDFNYSKKIFNNLGITTGIISNIENYKIKKNIYKNDIIYGTNNDFAFDYLKDALIISNKNKIQNELNYVIIDEIDSILIDEAKIPLIISKLYKNYKNFFYLFHFIFKILISYHNNKQNKCYYLNKRKNEIFLTDLGFKILEKILLNNNLLFKKNKLYLKNNIYYIYYINAFLYAYFLYEKDIHYIIKNNKIIIVNEFTGRISKNKRWSDGIHQALEIKENLIVQNNSKIISLINFKNYFRMYKKISGMTGTAYIEKKIFKKIYNLEVFKIYPNFINIRKDLPNKFFKNYKKKYKSLIKNVLCCYNKSQPVLIFTNSIKKSEFIAKLLNKIKLPFNILNAKNNINESKIISKAGLPKQITIVTNIASRGINIILGGNINNKIKKINTNYYYSNIKYIENKKKIFFLYKKWKKSHIKVLKSGGLYVMITEKYESKRIDNQLIGRSGRQGNPGVTRCFLSLKDSFFKKIKKKKIIKFKEKLKYKKNKIIKNKLLNKFINNIQNKNKKKNLNFEIQLLQYDIIYLYQKKILEKYKKYFLNKKKFFKYIIKLNKKFFLNLFKKKNYKLFLIYLKKKIFFNIFFLNFFINKYFLNYKKILKIILLITNNIYKKFLYYLNTKKFNIFIKKIILNNINYFYNKHLIFLNFLMKNIYLKKYCKKNPEIEFIIKSFYYLKKMFFLVKKEIIKTILLLNNDFYNYKY